MFDISKYKLSDQDGASLAAWQAANRYTYGRYLNVLSVCIMTAVIPFEMVLFDFQRKYVIVQLGLVAISLVTLALMTAVERTRDYASNPKVIQSAYSIGLLVPLLCVNFAHFWYLFTAPVADIGIVLAGLLMVTLFTTYFGHRFRFEQMIANIVCAALAIVASRLPTAASREFLLVSLVHMNAGIAAAYSRQLFGKFVGLQRELENKLQNQNDIIAAQSTEISRAQVYRSIADTTQMLAHDVRKPFSILVMGLRSLSGMKDPEKVAALAAKLIPEVNLALGRVNAMIDDIMEVGAPLEREELAPVGVEQLIDVSLRETFQGGQGLNISLGYELLFQGGVTARPKKLERLFSNILTNALQSMGPSGDVWFKTKPTLVSGKAMVEVTIGNSHSFVAAEDLPKLFDAFFTKGKRNGTGLGLAICRRIVEAHGGRIWARSAKTAKYPVGEVEFCFTLPASPSASGFSPVQLPSHSRHLSSNLPGAYAGSEAEGAMSDTSADRGERQLEAKIEVACKKLGRSLSVVIIDDESIYRNALTSYLTRRDLLDTFVIVKDFDGSTEALADAAHHAADLIVTDVDMGPASLSGFDLVVQLRLPAQSACSRSLICVHSNRIVAQDHRLAVESGADIFVPKPMARGQLLRLLLQAAELALAAMPVPLMATPAPLMPTLKQASLVVEGDGLPEVVFIDDNVFIGESWCAELAAGANVHYFESPEVFFAAVQTDSSLLARVLCVVTDYFFDGSDVNGLDLARRVKSMSPATLVFLSSDADFEESALAGAVDGSVGKAPLAADDLVALVTELRKVSRVS